MVAWGVSVNTTIIHTFLTSPACTDMVYSKEIEHDATTTALVKELPCLDIWHHSFIVHDRFISFTSEG